MIAISTQIQKILNRRNLDVKGKTDLLLEMDATIYTNCGTDSTISMCTDYSCPLKGRCFRYMAEPNYRQTYADFKYDDGCDYFYKIE